MIKSSEVVLLSIFKVIWWDPIFEIFVLMRVFIPYHILFQFFLLVFFVMTIQSDYLISAVFKFLMKNILTGGVASLAKLYSLFFTLIVLRMPDVIHGFDASLLIFRLGVDNGECLFIEISFSEQITQKISLCLFYIFLGSYPSLYFVNSSRKHFLLNFQIFGVSFLLLFWEISV